MTEKDLRKLIQEGNGKAYVYGVEAETWQRVRGIVKEDCINKHGVCLSDKVWAFIPWNMVHETEMEREQAIKLYCPAIDQDFDMYDTAKQQWRDMLKIDPSDTKEPIAQAVVKATEEKKRSDAQLAAMVEGMTHNGFNDDFDMGD